MRNIRKNMETKKLLVSFIMLVSVLFLVPIVSAANVTSAIYVEVDGIALSPTGPNPAIVVGDTVLVRVEFVSAVTTSDVTVEVEIKVGSEKVSGETRPFSVESDQTYPKTLHLKVPFDLDDVLSDFATLRIDISGKGYADSTLSFTNLRVQREDFNADIKSIDVPQTINAGDTFPVYIVLKNIGYNDLDDVYVTAIISALDIEEKVFFGDIVALECNDGKGSVYNYGVNITRKCNEDDEDTASGRIFLEVPYDVQSGIYALEVEVENDYTTSSEIVQVVIENAFSAGNFIVSGNDLLIVNPTNQLVVYRLIPQSTAVVSVSLSESIVDVQDGSIRTVTVDTT